MQTREVRSIWAELLTEAMTANPKLVCIDADLAKANGTFGLREIFPERALDVGIAEQNMASIAAGMTTFGFQPIIGTFCCFVSRMADQILLSIGYAGRNVKIMGTDPGILAEINGGTHMGVADVSMMRGIPEMTIFEVTDGVQLRKALPHILAYEGPMYIRMPRRVVPQVWQEQDAFELWKAQVLRQGSDVTLAACGIMVSEALCAAQLLEAQGISAEVIEVHTIKPLDQETLQASAAKTGAVVTCENANVTGGLYSAVCEVLAGQAPVECIGIQDRFGEVGRLPYLKQVMGMTAEDIAAAAIRAMSRKV